MLTGSPSAAAATPQPPQLRDLARLAEVIDQHAIVSITDRAGHIVHVNPLFCDISGYAADELLGRNHRMLKSNRHDPDFYAGMWRTISEGRTWQGEVCNRRKDGSEYWVRSTIVPFLDADGRPEQFISIRTDITPLKQSEEALRINEERLRRGQLAANIGTWDWDLGSGELYWSERIAPLFGYPPGTLTTSFDNFVRAIHPDDRKRVLDAVQDCLERDIPYEIEHRAIWPDGSVRWLLERGAVICGADGKASHMLGVVQDIHERKLAELKLAESERRLREAQTLARLGNWEADLVSGELFWSEEVYRIVGRDPASYTPSVAAFHALLHPDDREPMRDAERSAAITGALDLRHRIVRPDGSVRHVHELAQAERDADGRLLRLTGTVQDVTERVEAARKLRETEARFSFAVEGAGDGVWDWDLASGRMTLSEHYETMLGYAVGELDPSIAAWRAMVHPDDMPGVETRLSAYLAGDTPSYAVDLRIRCRDGSYKWVLCRGTVVERDRDGRPARVIGIHSDISASKAAEERLTVFRRVFDASAQAVGIADGQGRMLYQNRAHAGLLGYGDGELAGLSFAQLLPTADAEALMAQLRSRIDNDQVLIGQLPMQRKDGRVFTTFSNIGFVKDAHGNTQFIFNICTDFSEELDRRNELAQAKEAAERANQAKSDFLSSMSHELRTPMNAILGFAQLLEYDDRLDADQQDNVHEILKAGRHLLTLINEVLDLARIEAGHIDLSLEPVNLPDTIDDCLQLIQPLAQARDIRLECALPSAAVVRADRTRLKQVLLNLLSNAVKYNRSGGRVRLTAVGAGSDRMRVEIADTGPGIAPERMDDLFQPFNRLGAQNTEIEGTGIGLTITRRLMELMGGTVGAHSVVGEGSTFWIELVAESPALTEIGGERTVAATAPTASIAERRILCIDDNPVNLKLIAQMLGRLQHIHLVSAHTPDLGIELARAHRPDLILLDINMPGMDGYQLLQLFRNDPLLALTPVIAITANAMPRDIERGLAAGFSDYLTKPLDIERFLGAIDSCLASPRPS